MPWRCSSVEAVPGRFDIDSSSSGGSLGRALTVPSVAALDARRSVWLKLRLLFIGVNSCSLDGVGGGMELLSTNTIDLSSPSSLLWVLRLVLLPMEVTIVGRGLLVSRWVRLAVLKTSAIGEADVVLCSWGSGGTGGGKAPKTDECPLDDWLLASVF